MRYGSHARPLNLVLSRHNRPFWTGRSFQNVTPASAAAGFDGDLLFLQETWLLHQDLSVLETIHCNYLAFGSSGMDDNTRIMQGRHFGGVAFLYDKRLAHVFQPMTRSKRVIAARLTLSRNVKVILINGYFPCDNYSANHVDPHFQEVMDEVERIIHEYSGDEVIFGGDLNVDPKLEFHRENRTHRAASGRET